VFEKNLAAGKANPFLVCAIFRPKPEIHRWLCLASPDLSGVNVRQYAVPYAGALSHAETLLEGDWYIANPEEEAACVMRDKSDRAKALEQDTKDKMGKANDFFAGIVQSVRMQNEANAESKPVAVPPEVNAELEQLRAKVAELSKAPAAVATPESHKVKKAS